MGTLEKDLSVRCGRVEVGTGGRCTGLGGGGGEGGGASRKAVIGIKS